MFTGIVSEVGRLRSLRPGGVTRLAIEAPRTVAETEVGASIAVNGVCLTVVGLGGGAFEAEAMPETLRRTNLGALTPGGRVNLEAALRLGGRLDGHLVSGHVDGVARLLERRRAGDAWLLECSLGSPELARLLAPKGSVALDGVSLTLIEVHGDRFSVGVIPHTAEVTTLGELSPGWELNLEVDILARYLERLMGSGKGNDLDRGFLAEHGFL